MQFLSGIDLFDNTNLSSQVYLPGLAKPINLSNQLKFSINIM